MHEKIFTEQLRMKKKKKIIKTQCFSNGISPVSTFKLGTQEGVLKIKGDTLSRWSPFRDFRQAKDNPRVNFSETELSFEHQCIHWPMTG